MRMCFTFWPCSVLKTRVLQTQNPTICKCKVLQPKKVKENYWIRTSFKSIQQIRLGNEHLILCYIIKMMGWLSNNVIKCNASGKRKACFHVANAFLSRLEPIKLIFYSLKLSKMPKKGVLLKITWCQCFKREKELGDAGVTWENW